MKSNKQQSGFTAVEALVILLVLVALAGAGWFVWKAKDKTKTPSANSSSTITSTAATNKWTGAGGDLTWSNAKNWSLGTPKNGQNLEIDVEKIRSESQGTTTNVNVTDDIANLSVNKITFDGKSPGSIFYIEGKPLTITGGINMIATTTETDKNSPGINQVFFDNDLTLSKDQTVNVTATETSQGEISLGGTTYAKLNIGSNTITFSSGKYGSIAVDDMTSGTGKYIVPSGDNQGVGFGSASPDFDGSVVIGSGNNVGIGNATLVGSKISANVNAFGNSSVEVQDGATLSFGTQATSMTISNPITMSGSGVATGANKPGIPTKMGALEACLSNGAGEGCNNGTTVTLTGQITLTGNTQLGMDPGCGAYGCEAPKSTTNTFTFTKPIKGNYALTAVQNSMVKIVKP